MFATDGQKKIIILLKGKKEPEVFEENGVDEMFGMSKSGLFGVYDNIWTTNTAEGMMRPNLDSKIIQAKPIQIAHERCLFPLDAIEKISIEFQKIKTVPLILAPPQSKKKSGD